jgi:deoxycytidylate deaminase
MLGLTTTEAHCRDLPHFLCDIMSLKVPVHLANINDPRNAALLTAMKGVYGNAASSKDPKTQVSAILYQFNPTGAFDPSMSIGWGINEQVCQLAALPKNDQTVHAEAKALLRAQNRKPGKTTVMVSSWAACRECAVLMVAANVDYLFTHVQALARTPSHWQQSIRDGLSILLESGVNVVVASGRVFQPATVMFDGERWAP